MDELILLFFASLYRMSFMYVDPKVRKYHDIIFDSVKNNRYFDI